MNERNINDYINQLDLEFRRNSNREVALQQESYMKNKFKFLGLKSKERRIIQRPFLFKDYLPDKSESFLIVKRLWEKGEREFHYFGQELLFKNAKKLEIQDITFLEYIVANKSWWDTVDFISTKLMGHYFKIYPDKRALYVNKWIISNNIWIMRSALLFQLKYKDNLDTDLMSFTINTIKDTDQFFINKAIGWILREYSKTNSEWVVNFVERNKLSNLSKREALRLIN